jgi:hypothetical protein
MVTSQPPAISTQQLDLFSYAAAAATAPPSQPSAPTARVSRTLRAAAWLPVELVRGMLTQPGTTILQIVLDGMIEEDTGDTATYEFGAREVRRLLVEVPATSQIRITDNPGEDRAMIVEIRAANGRDPHTRMLIRDGAWYTEPAAKLPARRERWRMGQEAYTAAYQKALAERAKKSAAKTVRVTLLEPEPPTA